MRLKTALTPLPSATSSGMKSCRPSGAACPGTRRRRRPRQWTTRPSPRARPRRPRLPPNTDPARLHHKARRRGGECSATRRASVSTRCSIIRRPSSTRPSLGSSATGSTCLTSVCTTQAVTTSTGTVCRCGSGRFCSAFRASRRARTDCGAMTPNASQAIGARGVTANSRTASF